VTAVAAPLHPDYGAAAMMKARRGSALSASIALLSAVLLAGCFLDTSGVDPVPGAINFPTSIVMAPAGTSGAAPGFVYVVNSNFDLRYNGGTVMSLDLARIATAIAACTETPCVLRKPSDFLAAGHEVTTGSYAGGAAISSDGTRFYAPFRSDGSLTFIDVDPTTGELTCQSSGATGGRCDDSHRRGDDPSSSIRHESMPGDPSRVLLQPRPNPADGDFLVVLDRSGKASLFFDRTTGTRSPAPTLIDVVDGLPPSAVGLAYDAAAGISYVSSSNTSPTARLARVGVAIDEASGGERSYLFRAGEPRLSGLDDGLDVRDLAFDGDRLYLLSRRPQAVVFIDLTRAGFSGGELPIERVISVDYGASRLALATIGGRRLLFVTCYDGRSMFVIDAQTGAVEDVVRGFSGPYEVAVDEVRALAFVSDFRSSVVRVVDLGPLADGTSEPLQIVATIGVPRAPSELN
jgi:DNA-binding beta-propeller fold protein YncE